MKIKDAKSAMLFKKCLTARQFQSYAKLCEIMKDFDELRKEEERKINNLKAVDMDNVSLTNPIDELLKKYLPLAAQGDLSFLLDSEEFQKALEKFPNNSENPTQDRIVENFKKYSTHSKIFSDFKKADDLLNNSLRKTKDGTVQFSKKDFKGFETAMNTNTVSKFYAKFYENFKKHSSKYLGFQNFVISKDSLDTISTLQPDSELSKSAHKITPESFDANIQGFYSPRKHTRNMDRLSEFENKNPNTLSEFAYTHTLGKLYTAPEGTLKRIGALSATGIVGLALSHELYTNYAQDYIDEFNSVNVYNAGELGYRLQISSETQQQIEEARKLLDSLKNSNEFASVEELRELRNLLDDSSSNVISDLARKAIERDSDINVDDVEVHYDLSNEASPYWISYTYTDEEYNEQRTRNITDLSNGGFLVTLYDPSISIEHAFDNEVALDQDFPALLRKYENAQTVEERTAAYTEIKNFYEEILAKIEVLGAKQFEFKPGWSSKGVELQPLEPKEIDGR